MRRAKAVASQLRALGVKDEQMIIASLGDNVPFRYQGKHQLSKDRRVEIVPVGMVEEEMPAEPVSQPQPKKRVTEIVIAGSRLAQIARRHYGNPDYWVYIYEANKDKIANPSKVTPGLELVIPDISEIKQKEQEKMQ